MKTRMFAALIAAVLAALVLTPAAKADPTDDYNYIQELYAYGVTRQSIGASPAQFLGLGHAICNDLGSGHDPNAEASSIERARPNLTQHQAQGLVSVSVANYCPDVLPRPLPWSPQG